MCNGCGGGGVIGSSIAQPHSLAKQVCWGFDGDGPTVAGDESCSGHLARWIGS